MRKHSLIAAALVCAGLAASGCMDVDNEVLIRKDGSGQMTAVMGFGGPMAAAMGGNLDEMFAQTKKQVEEFVAKNPGATLEKFDIVKEPSPQITVVIAVPDVNQFDFAGFDLMNQQPGGEGEEGEKKEKTPLITLKDGVLTLVNKDAGELMQNLNAEALSPEQVAQAGMMKAMVGDMKMVSRLRVEGAVKQTNARHFDKATGTITIVEMPFGAFVGAIAEKTDDLKKAVELPDANAKAQALEKVVAGLKLEGAPSITVTFE